jgi:hypothetical protein
VQDLEKAQWYLNKLIEVKKSNKDSTNIEIDWEDLEDGC